MFGRAQGFSRLGGVAALAVLVVTTTGCDVEQPYEPTPSTAAAEALDELRALPSLEETMVQVQAAMDQITAAASTLIPSIGWQTVDQGTTGNCEHPYEQTGGKRRFLPDAVADTVAVSEDQWVVIEQAATSAAATLDATDVQVMHNEPGNHDVWFTGPTGIFIKVGYRGSLVVSGYTGCRLPAH